MLLRRGLAALLYGLLAAPAAAQAPAASLTRIGAAAAVHGLVKAQAPDQPVGRVLESGKPLFLNDHVTTDSEGRLQIMLLDQTIFTIGPNSDLVLDEFVYDPSTSAGKVTARIVKGFFRFVTGKIASNTPANMKVNLPIGTIGIRGTIVNGVVNGQTSQVVLGGPGLHPSIGEKPGAFVVTANGASQLVEREGYGVTVGPQGVTSPAPMFDVSRLISGALATTGGKGQDISRLTINPTDDSGHSTGKAIDPALDTQGTVQSVTILNNAITQANQDATTSIVDGISRWEQITASIPSGTGTYFGPTGTFTQTAGCTGTCTGTWSFNASVDFGARTYSISAAIIPAGNMSIPSDSLFTPITSFGTSGPATVTGTGTAGAQYTFSFLNQGGTPAKLLQGDVSYSDLSGNKGAGATLKAPFTPGGGF